MVPGTMWVGVNSNIRSESAAVMMYKSLHEMTPENLSSRFVHVFRNDITSYRVRNTENKLALPRPRINYLKSFSDSGARLWNSLSSDLSRSNIST